MAVRKIALSIDLSSSYGRQILRGIIAYVQKHRSWQIEMRNAMPYVSPPQLARWKGDGMIVQVYNEDQAETIRRKGIPVVNITSALLHPPLPTVSLDNEAIGRMAAEHLLAKGLRNFAFVGPAYVRFSLRRLAGFQQTIEGHGLSCGTSLFCGRRHEVPVPPSLMVRASTHRRWLRGLDLPVGVLAADDRVGYGVLEACRDLGIACPDEVALVGVDNDEMLCTLSSARMSSVDTNAQQAGYEAAGLLEGLMKGAAAPAEPVEVKPVGVVQRNSSDILAVKDADVAEALRFIRNHAGEPIDVSDVMKIAAISRRSLERRFRESVGRGIYQEIRRLRIERAKQLLAETDWPIMRVARESGFNSFLRFEATFRGLEGMPASRFRKMVRESSATLA
jgi:LacI family transcriptional regulator